jgi:Tfp pilus assembly protein PilF
LIRKEYDQAEAEFKQALQIDPGMALAWTYLGSLADTRGDEKEAMANYDKALTLDKRQPLANLGKADLLAKTGHKGEALALYRFALYLFPPPTTQYAYASERIQQLEGDLKKQ